MKKLIAIVALVMTALTVSAQGRFKITGRVLDPSKQPVAYATAVLLDGNGNQVVGTSTTAEGHFELSAVKGDYTLMVTFIGFENFSQVISLTGNLSLGEITLSPSSQKIDAVVITEHAIKREADRFIVTVAANPLASGKDAFEVLRTAPGVWVSKSNGITINGQSGTRVMIDDRIINMSADDLEIYLRNIPASDIARIEVIPSSGAEYDADTSGGIIKIVMVKKRTSGLDGNIGMRAGWSPENGSYNLSPNGRINYFEGNLNLYAQLGMTHRQEYNTMEERTEYVSGKSLASNSLMDEITNRYNTKLGAVYDLSKRSSIGAEFSYFGRYEDETINGTSIFTEALNKHIDNKSEYNINGTSRYFGTSLNYIYKLDDKGSTIKVLGDWNGNLGGENNRYFNEADIVNGGTIHTDSTSRSVSSSRYNVYSLGADVELINSASRSIKFGAKYTRNEMFATQLYEGLDKPNNIWLIADGGERPTNYNENIGAIYGIYNQKFGNISMSLGLRGEYTAYNPTYTDPDSGQTITSHKSYVDIFPTLTLNVPFNVKQTHILIGNFSRRISRPGFWALNPFRDQISEYSYVIGNPDLKPTYSNNAMLTYVYKYRYTITAGIQFRENEVQQKIFNDPNNSDILMYKFTNIPLTRAYVIALNAPFALTDWWSINLNGVFLYQEQRMEADGATKYNPLGIANLTSTFTLPKQWEIEASFWGMTRIMNANMMIDPMYNMEIDITKRIKKWTLGLNFSNILQHGMIIRTEGADFNKWARANGDNGGFFTIGLSVRYNFNSGVKFKNRTVQSGTEEDRINGGGGGIGGVPTPGGN